MASCYVLWQFFVYVFEYQQFPSLIKHVHIHIFPPSTRPLHAMLVTKHCFVRFSNANPTILGFLSILWNFRRFWMSSPSSVDLFVVISFRCL